MKEKIILKTNWAAPYWSFELPLSELYAQLKEQGIDPERPFCEPAECEHEWDFSGKWICTKCKEVRSSQPQKPKIDLLALTKLPACGDEWEIAIKINKLIKAVNGLYER